MEYRKESAKLTRQLEILVLDLDEVPVLAQLRLIEEGNGFPSLGEANELLPVNTNRVGENTASVDDSNCLIVTEKNLVYGRAECRLGKELWREVRTGSEIAIWSTGLDLCNVLLPKAKLFVNSEYVLSDRQRGHSVGVMRDTAEFIRALSSGEGFPPIGTTVFGVKGSPIHHVSGALCAIGL